MATIYDSNEIIPEDPIYLTITGTASAEIRYTKDGTIPNSTSTLYKSPIELQSGEEICARQYLEGYQPSDPTYFTNYIPQINIQKKCSLSQQFLPADNADFTNDSGGGLRYSFKLYKAGDYYFLRADLHGINNTGDSSGYWDTSECYLKSLLFYSQDFETWNPIELFNNGDIISGASKKRTLSYNIPKDVFYYKGNYYFVYLKVDDNYLTNIGANTTDTSSSGIRRWSMNNNHLSEGYTNDSTTFFYIYKTASPEDEGKEILIENDNISLHNKAATQVTHLLGEKFMLLGFLCPNYLRLYSGLNILLSQDEGNIWYSVYDDQTSSTSYPSTGNIQAFFQDGNYYFVVVYRGESSSSTNTTGGRKIYSRNPLNENFSSQTLPAAISGNSYFYLNLLKTSDSKFIFSGGYANNILPSTLQSSLSSSGSINTEVAYHKGWVLGLYYNRWYDPTYEVSSRFFNLQDDSTSYQLTGIPDNLKLFSTDDDSSPYDMYSASWIFQPEGEEDHAFITLYDGYECLLYEITYENPNKPSLLLADNSNPNPKIKLRLIPAKEIISEKSE